MTQDSLPHNSIFTAVTYIELDYDISASIT